MLRVVVASGNPVKVAAAQAAFASVFPRARLEMLRASVASGVSDQPASDAETRRGARNRAVNARRARPEGDFWVGLEGGIEVIGERLMGFAWMAVTGRCGHLSEARSVTLPLPPGVRALVEEGLELGDANDRVFATANSKQAGGAFGLLTGGLHTRQSVYAQTLVMALIPFANELYPCATHREERGS